MVTSCCKERFNYSNSFQPLDLCISCSLWLEFPFPDLRVASSYHSVFNQTLASLERYFSGQRAPHHSLHIMRFYYFTACVTAWGYLCALSHHLSFNWNVISEGQRPYPSSSLLYPHHICSMTSNSGLINACRVHG